jgi:hypothetical protein
LFTALPPRKGRFEDLTDAYHIALDGCSYEALKLTTVRAIRGEVEGLSQTFGPTPPELAKAIRDTDRSLSKLAELKALPDYRIGERLNYVEMQTKALAKMAAEGRPHLRDVPRAKDMHRFGKGLPVGSLYVACLGAFYGPATIKPEKEFPSPDEIERIRQREAIKRMHTAFKAEIAAMETGGHIDDVGPMDRTQADYWRQIAALKDAPDVTPDQFMFRQQMMAKVEKAEQHPEPEGDQSDEHDIAADAIDDMNI